MNFITQLEHEFEQHRNREIALPMENYMKNNFSFLGIKAEMRRAIMKQCYQEHTPEIKENFRKICWELFNKNEREYHIVALDLFIKEVKKNYLNEDIYLFEKMIVTHSWWDSVDTISKYLLGQYLIEFPNETEKVIEGFSNSNNMWLNRSAILFQLGYKKKTNYELLFSECVKHAQSKEFFIQKAIGWALREYGSVNPDLVLNFVNNTDLKPLSKKEAIRKLI